VPTPCFYYMIQRNFDMRKSLNFPHHGMKRIRHSVWELREAPQGNAAAARP